MENDNRMDRIEMLARFSPRAAVVYLQRMEMEDELKSHGGRAKVRVLCTLDGTEVRAKVIIGRYGVCWHLLDRMGKGTGEFVSYEPAREQTLAKRGYKEVLKFRPAKIMSVRGELQFVLGSPR